MADDMLLLMAQFLKNQKELDELKNKPQRQTSSKIKKIGGVLHIPMNATGKALKRVSEFTEDELKEFKAKNMRKTADTYRGSAAWSLTQADRLEKEAEALWPTSNAQNLDYDGEFNPKLIDNEQATT